MNAIDTEQRLLALADKLFQAGQCAERDATPDEISRTVFAVLAAAVTEKLVNEMGHDEKAIWPYIEHTLESARAKFAASWQSLPPASAALN